MGYDRGSDIPNADTHVSRIRSKLGLIPNNGWQLKGVYGHGYRLEQVSGDEAWKKPEVML